MGYEISADHHTSAPGVFRPARHEVLASVAPADANPKDIAGRAKPQMHLIPAAAKVEVAKVMGLGAAKYGPYNWRDVPVAYGPYLAAIERHATAFVDGQNLDPESACSHLAHIAAGAMILLDAIITGNAKDDRPKPNPRFIEPS